MKLATTIKKERGKIITITANEYIQCNFTVNRENRFEITFYSNGIQILNYKTGKSRMIFY